MNKPQLEPTRFRSPLTLIAMLALPVAFSACGEDPCVSGRCMDVGTVRSSQVSVSFPSERNYNQTISVSFPLPDLPPDSGCWEIPEDLEITANGRPAFDKKLVTTGLGFNAGCHEPRFTALFEIPGIPESVTIRFARNGEETAIRVTRPGIRAIDVVLPLREVKRSATFKADLRSTGALPSNEACWSPLFVWDDNNRVEVLNLGAGGVPENGGVLTLTLTFAHDAPAGAGKLWLRSTSESACAPPPPAGASCPGIAGCTVFQGSFGRELGPYPLTLR